MLAFFCSGSGAFDVEVEQLLAVDEGHAHLFGLRGVDQHFLHVRATRYERATDGC
jgi:hypothetical protein